jgi:Family of unknown function (DUF5946)
VALHLIAMSPIVEDGTDPMAGPALHKRLAKRSAFHWLEPPRGIGEPTIADVREAATAAEHERAVRGWALDVWTGWAPPHAAIRRRIDEHLGDDSNRRIGNVTSSSARSSFSSTAYSPGPLRPGAVPDDADAPPPALSGRTSAEARIASCVLNGRKHVELVDGCADDETLKVVAGPASAKGHEARAITPVRRR